MELYTGNPLNSQSLMSYCGNLDYNAESNSENEGPTWKSEKGCKDLGLFV